MSKWRTTAAWFGAGVLAVLQPPAFAGTLVVDSPTAERNTRSLRDAIVAAHDRNRALHIVFVHGIRAEGPGASVDFANRLADAIGAPRPREATVHYLDLGTRPAAVMAGTYSGNGDARIPIWRDDAEWLRSRPFVNRTQLAGKLGSVVVDEFNYWPLLLALKCRFLLEPEHDLAGNDAAHLTLCRDDGWIAPAELDELLSAKPRSRGGARLNAVAKQQIMNWGLADAVVALGSMQTYLHDTLDQAFDFALKDAPPDQDYVVIAESLGSFVVLDAYAASAPHVARLLDRTADLYFFANQFALLELARIRLPGPASVGGVDLQGKTAASLPVRSPLAALTAWGAGPKDAALLPRGGQPKQIVAFSDPSDLLTYRMPSLDQVTVVNIYDRNEHRLFGLLADPLRAHVGHVDNPAVWKFLMRRTRFSR